MPRPTYELDDWRDTLSHWILQEKVQQQEILVRLNAAGVKVSRSTLARRLNDWNISVAPKAQDSEDMRARIHEYHHQRLTDEQAMKQLNEAGYNLATGALSRIRRKMGLYKQVKPSQQDDEEKGIREALQREFDAGTLDAFKRSELHELMRSKYNYIGRDRIFKIAASMYPDRALRRVPNEANERRRERDRARARMHGIPERRFRGSAGARSAARSQPEHEYEHDAAAGSQLHHQQPLPPSLEDAVPLAQWSGDGSATDDQHRLQSYTAHHQEIQDHTGYDAATQYEPDDTQQIDDHYAHPPAQHTSGHVDNSADPPIELDPSLAILSAQATLMQAQAQAQAQADAEMAAAGAVAEVHGQEQSHPDAQQIPVQYHGRAQSSEAAELAMRLQAEIRPKAETTAKVEVEATLKSEV